MGYHSYSTYSQAYAQPNQLEIQHYYADPYINNNIQEEPVMYNESTPSYNPLPTQFPSSSVEDNLSFLVNTTPQSNTSANNSDAGKTMMDLLQGIKASVDHFNTLLTMIDGRLQRIENSMNPLEETQQQFIG